MSIIECILGPLVPTGSQNKLYLGPQDVSLRGPVLGMLGKVEIFARANRMPDMF